MFFDSHAHYDDEAFSEDRFQLLSDLHSPTPNELDADKHLLDYIINCGADLVSSRLSVDLARKFDFIFAAVGVHPENVGGLSESDLDELESLAKNKNEVRAIGEIGLDYHYENYNREEQIFWFEQQILLANKLNLPIIVHSRDAAEDTFKTIKQFSKTSGVVHCYSGSLEMAREYINLGFFIGIGGTVTFKNANKVVEVVRNIPIQNILLETDCPYLSPVPNRGKRNDSSNLFFIAEKISQIKNIPLDNVAQITSQNAKRLFAVN